MNLRKLSIDGRPSSMALTMEAKLSPVKMTSAPLWLIGAGDAHRHADVGLAQGGRVVHAVARHGHDLAARWKAATSLSLCSGAMRAQNQFVIQRGAQASSSIASTSAR